MRPLPCLLVLLAGTLLPAQNRVAWLEGPTPTSLQLLVVDEQNPGGSPQAVLTNVELLPVEITMRTTQQELRADRPRRVTRNGVTSIELPNNGRLLRYRRGNASQYGFLWVEASGEPRVLLELPASAGQDPFADRFGVANDGRHAAFVTATGELWLARLDGNNWPSTGAPVRALAVGGGGVNPLTTCVGQSQLFVMTQDERAWRAPLTDGSSLQDVTPPKGPNDKLKDEFALSGDGSTVVFLLGPDKLFSLWLLGSQGAAVRLPPPPAKYEEPGYLPEQVAGPRMLLNDDATRLLYTDASNRDEIYLLDTTGATPTTHLTSDANFEPYIGIGVLPAFSLSTIVIGIGDPAAFDWISASTGAPLVNNLTGTAGGGPPFGAGTLVPVAGYDLGNGMACVEERQANGAIDLRLVDLTRGTTQTVGRGLRASPTVGRGGASPNLLLPMFQGDVFTAGLTPLLAGPPGVLLSPDSQLPGMVSAFTATLGTSNAAILRINDGSLLALPPDGQLRQVLLTSTPGLVLNGTQLVYFGIGVTAVLSSSTGTRILIS